MNTMTLSEFRKTAESRFGKSGKDWLFICPSCKTIQSFHDFEEANLTDEKIKGYIGFSCIGRFSKNKGCDWTLGGLLRIHTLEIITEDRQHHPHFEIAEKPKAKNSQDLTGKDPESEKNVNSQIT